MCRVTTRLFLTSDLYNIELYSVILLCQSVRYSSADNHFHRYQMLVIASTIYTYSSPCLLAVCHSFVLLVGNLSRYFVGYLATLCLLRIISDRMKEGMLTCI